MLAERQRFALHGDRWTEFMAALDAPPCPLPRLARLFRAAMPRDRPDSG
jgi:uncharacterized protein (DUF1778 family)